MLWFIQLLIGGIKTLDWVFSEFYRLNVCVHTPPSPKFICWCEFQCDAIRKWGLWEVIRSWAWSPMNEICALMRWDTRKIIPPSLHHLRTEQEVSHLQTRSRFSPDLKSAGTLILDLPAFRTMRNKCRLSHPVYGIFQQLEQRLCALFLCQL